MSHLLKAILLFIVISGCEFGRTQAQVRMSTDEAEKLLIEAPVAEYPPIARAAHAQGLVKVEVTISELGLVTAAKAVSGHPLLQSAAVKAVRTYKYQPYVVDGKPTSFVTDVYVLFPSGPLTKERREELEHQDQSANQYFAEETKCRDLSRAKNWKQAEESCGALVRIADQLSTDRALEKMLANESLGHVFTGQGRYQEAIESYNRALTVVGSTLTDTNVELGHLYGELAIAHHLRGDLEKARELYRRAEKIYQLAHASMGDRDSDQWIEERKKAYMKDLRSLLQFHLRAAEDSGATAEVEEINRLLKTLP
jgi:TonB family protein